MEKHNESLAVYGKKNERAFPRRSAERQCEDSLLVCSHIGTVQEH